jgi:transposase
MERSSDVVVGIDVSKARLDVHVLPGGDSFTVPRDEAGYGALVARLAGLGVRVVAMEATGGLETPVVVALHEAGLPVAVLNPRQVRDVARGLGQLAKNDAIDAAMIARFAEVAKLTGQPVPEASARRLGELMARRRQLIGMRTAETNRLQQTADKRVRRSIERVLKTIEAELKSLDRDLDDAIRQSPIWRDVVELLESQPGIGKVTARTLVADLPELGRTSGKKIAALVGLAPYCRDSGTMRGKRMIWGGRADIRATLYMATLAAIRSNPTIRAFHHGLIARGKAPKVAIVACMRKIVVHLNAILARHYQNAQTKA